MIPIAELEVIQADREMAAWVAKEANPEFEPMLSEAHLAGWSDESPLVQALAKHRLSAWQPIDSAPKDGTRIIVAKFAWVHTAVEDIFKEDAPKIWHLCFATTAHFLSDRRYWTDGLERLVEPTHWLALPTPPQPEARS